jgi:hypothetical protein
MQTALQYQHLSYQDVTPPIASGDERKFWTQSAFMVDKFMRDQPMVPRPDRQSLPVQ